MTFYIKKEPGHAMEGPFARMIPGPLGPNIWIDIYMCVCVCVFIEILPWKADRAHILQAQNSTYN